MKQVDLKIKKISDYAKLPVYLDDVDPTKSRVTYTDTNGTWPSVITTSCKNAEKAMDFFDFMWSDEGQILTNWGIEGVNYTIDENGKKVLKDQMIWDFLNDNNFRFRTGVLLYDHWQAGSLLKDDNGEYYNPYSNISTGQISEIDIEVKRHYNESALNWSDLWPESKISEWGLLWKYDIASENGMYAYNYINSNYNYNYVRDMIRSINQGQFDSTWYTYKQACYNKIGGATKGIGDCEDMC